jgi:transcriptional regulator of heat shock response
VLFILSYFFQMKKDDKMLALLDLVIDQYISSGDPVWSKSLNSLDSVGYAPSTLRKYLNLLEKSGMVYQPYNSSGRVPTVSWLIAYIENYMSHDINEQEMEVESARKWLKYLVENLWAVADWVVVWFLKSDEYYYIGMNNILRDDLMEDYDTTRYIIKLIETRWLVKELDSKLLKRNKVYYTFIQDKKIIVSCIYAKIVVEEYEGMICIVWPTRVDYKKNVALLDKVVSMIGS